MKDSELAELKAQCLKAKFRGFQIAHANELAKVLSAEAGVQTIWNVSPQNLLNLIAVIEHKRKLSEAPAVTKVEETIVLPIEVCNASVLPVPEPAAIQAVKPVVRRGRPKKS